MSYDSITYRMGPIENIVTSFQTWRTQTESELEGLWGEYRRIFGSEFIGKTSEAVDIAKEKIRKGFDEVQLGVGEVAQRLRDGAQAMSHADNQLSQA